MGVSTRKCDLSMVRIPGLGEKSNEVAELGGKIRIRRIVDKNRSKSVYTIGVVDWRFEVTRRVQ